MCRNNHSLFQTIFELKFAERFDLGGLKMEGIEYKQKNENGPLVTSLPTNRVHKIKQSKSHPQNANTKQMFQNQHDGYG
ncbi:MAG: hypothetical protein CNLJKLNK_00207 [Holosporales bacterium]